MVGCSSFGQFCARVRSFASKQFFSCYTFLLVIYFILESLSRGYCKFGLIFVHRKKWRKGQIRGEGKYLETQPGAFGTEFIHFHAWESILTLYRNGVSSLLAFLSVSEGNGIRLVNFNADSLTMIVIIARANPPYVVFFWRLDYLKARNLWQVTCDRVFWLVSCVTFRGIWVPWICWRYLVLRHFGMLASNSSSLPLRLRNREKVVSSSSVHHRLPNVSHSLFSRVSCV